jgi:hypothetical protein
LGTETGPIGKLSGWFARQEALHAHILSTLLFAHSLDNSGRGASVALQHFNGLMQLLF